MNYNVNDSTTTSIYKGILSMEEISQVVDKKDVIPSQALIQAFHQQEGRETSFIPEIGYKGTKFLKVPQQFGSGNKKLDRNFIKQCKEKGIGAETIEKVRHSMPANREWQEKQITSYMNSKDFVLEKGETMEEARRLLTPFYFPFTFFSNDDIPQCGPLIVPCKVLRDAEIRCIRASMPPGDLDGPLYGSYIETCMRVLCSGMKVTNHTKIYFTFRVISLENKIVFYVCPLHGKEEEKKEEKEIVTEQQ